MNAHILAHTHILVRINKFSKVAGYKISTQKIFVFLYANIE